MVLLLLHLKGAMSKREQFGEHYGGGHEDKDTFSHLKDGFVPDEGFDIVEGLAHYGGGHENKDTADHFGVRHTSYVIRHCV